MKILPIDELIKKKEKNKKQQRILIKFKKKYQQDDRIEVDEHLGYFKITVSHPSKDGYTGGAECYKVDKKTGEQKMLWHEHPMEIPTPKEWKEADD